MFNNNVILPQKILVPVRKRVYFTNDDDLHILREVASHNPGGGGFKMGAHSRKYDTDYWKKIFGKNHERQGSKLINKICCKGPER